MRILTLDQPHARLVALGVKPYETRSWATAYRGLVAIHAGVIRWNGCAALLPGASQAGKTTLIGELVARGAVYYSDEYALLDSGGRVHPYPRALFVRTSGGWRHPKLPSTGNGAAAESDAPVRLIAFLKWIPGGKWNVRPIPQSEALLALLGNSPRAMETDPGMPRALRPSVSSAVCYAGERGEAAEAAGHLIQLLTDLR